MGAIPRVRFASGGKLNEERVAPTGLVVRADAVGGSLGAYAVIGGRGGMKSAYGNEVPG